MLPAHWTARIRGWGENTRTRQLLLCLDTGRGTNEETKTQQTLERSLCVRTSRSSAKQGAQHVSDRRLDARTKYVSSSFSFSLSPPLVSFLRGCRLKLSVPVCFSLLPRVSVSAPPFNSPRDGVGCPALQSPPAAPRVPPLPASRQCASSPRRGPSPPAAAPARSRRERS